jgi:hypothetical protein
MPGRLLPPRVRKVLVWVHLAGINAVAIGEQCLVCFAVAVSEWLGNVHCYKLPWLLLFGGQQQRSRAADLSLGSECAASMALDNSAALTCRAVVLHLPATAIYYGETSYVDETPFGEEVPWTENTCNPNATNRHHSPWAAMFVLAWFLATLSFQLCCPLEYQPAGFHVPSWLMPWLPSFALSLLIFR